MHKIFKLKNFSDWKTTILTIVGGALLVVGVLWPDKFNEATKETLLEGVDQILIGLGAIIPIIVGLFGAKDGDK